MTSTASVTGSPEEPGPRTGRTRILTVIGFALVVITAPLWLPIVVLVGGVQLGWAAALYAAVWTWWIGLHRQRVLFVYSDSPNWKDHIERDILPRLPGHAVVLNWSQRRQWRRSSLPVLLFRTFAGRREFNPIAMIFFRFALVERIRFWQAFRDAKHGNDGPLRTLEAALFESLRDESSRR